MLYCPISHVHWWIFQFLAVHTLCLFASTFEWIRSNVLDSCIRFAWTWSHYLGYLTAGDVLWYIACCSASGWQVVPRSPKIPTFSIPGTGFLTGRWPLHFHYVQPWTSRMPGQDSRLHHYEGMQSTESWHRNLDTFVHTNGICLFS